MELYVSMILAGKELVIGALATLLSPLIHI